MKINKAWADRQPNGVDNFVRLKWYPTDSNDFTSPNSQRTDGIQLALWINHPAIINGDVVGLRRLTTGQQRQCGARHQDCETEASDHLNAPRLSPAKG
jgi:hypothetical protein